MGKLRRNFIDMVEDRRTGTKLSETLNDHAVQLAQKAQQADLDTANTNIAKKANQSDLFVTNNNVTSTNSRIDTLVINSGNANAEVSDAHVSTAKNKTYTTLRNRLEAVETDNIPIYRVAQTVGMGVKNYQSNATVTDNGNGTFALVKTVTGSDGFEITINYNRDIDLSFSFDGDTSTMGTVTMQRYNGGTFLNNLYAGATITKGSKTLTAQDIVTMTRVLLLISGTYNGNVTITAKDHQYPQTLLERIVNVETTQAGQFPIYQISQTVPFTVAGATSNGNGIYTFSGKSFDISPTYGKDVDVTFTFTGDISTLGTVTGQTYNGGTWITNKFVNQSVTTKTLTLTASEIAAMTRLNISISGTYNGNVIVTVIDHAYPNPLTSIIDGMKIDINNRVLHDTVLEQNVDAYKNLFNINDSRNVYGSLITSSGYNNFSVAGDLRTHPIAVTPGDYYIPYDARFDPTIYCAMSDANGNYISSIAGTHLVSNDGHCFKFTITQSGYACFNSYTDKNNFRVFKGYYTSLPVPYYGEFVHPDLFDNYSIKFKPKWCLPSTIYARKNNSISVFYENVIKYSQNIDKRKCFIAIRAYQNGTEMNLSRANGFVMFPYQMQWTPSTVGTYTIEFGLFETFSKKPIDKQTVTFIVVDDTTKTGRTINVLTLADSFSASFGVSSQLQANLKSLYGTVNMVGTRNKAVYQKCASTDSGALLVSYDNNTGHINIGDYILTVGNYSPVVGDYVKQVDTIHDEAYGGKDYSYFVSDATCPLVLNGSFNFANYMSTKYPSYVPSNQTGTHLDYVCLLLGINEGGNVMVSGYESTLVGNINNIINGIHAWDSNIKILIQLNPPEKYESQMHYESSFLRNVPETYKYSNEIFNDIILRNFAGLSMVYILATSAHFDRRFGTITSTFIPCKFKTDYTEDLGTDIHPTSVGKMYLADTVTNYIVGLDS